MLIATIQFQSQFNSITNLIHAKWSQVIEEEDREGNEAMVLYDWRQACLVDTCFMIITQYVLARRINKGSAKTRLVFNGLKICLLTSPDNRNKIIKMICCHEGSKPQLYKKKKIQSITKPLTWPPLTAKEPPLTHVFVLSTCGFTNFKHEGIVTQ